MFKNLFTKKELIVLGIIAVESYVIYKIAERMDKELADAIDKFKADEERVNDIFDNIDLNIQTPNIDDLMNKED